MSKQIVLRAGHRVCSRYYPLEDIARPELLVSAIFPHHRVLSLEESATLYIQLLPLPILEEGFRHFQLRDFEETGGTVSAVLRVLCCRLAI